MNKIKQAIEVFLESKIGSTSLLKQRLQVSHKEALSIVDTLCKCGVIGKSQGVKPRKLLVETLKDGLRLVFKDSLIFDTVSDYNEFIKSKESKAYVDVFIIELDDVKSL